MNSFELVKEKTRLNRLLSKAEYEVDNITSKYYWENDSFLDWIKRDGHIDKLKPKRKEIILNVSKGVMLSSSRGATLSASGRRATHKEIDSVKIFKFASKLIEKIDSSSCFGVPRILQVDKTVNVLNGIARKIISVNNEKEFSKKYFDTEYILKGKNNGK